MYTTDLIHSACVEQHATLELSVDSEFLLSGGLFLHIYVFTDISCRLLVVKMAIVSTGPIANHCPIMYIRCIFPWSLGLTTGTAYVIVPSHRNLPTWKLQLVLIVIHSGPGPPNFS